MNPFFLDFVKIKKKGFMDIGQCTSATETLSTKYLHLHLKYQKTDDLHLCKSSGKEAIFRCEWIKKEPEKPALFLLD